MAQVVPIGQSRERRGKGAARNRRVHTIQKGAWARGRLAKFHSAVGYASAAKAMRTALGVTQVEMGRHFGVTGARVCQWESGSYFGWDAKELVEYVNACKRIAGL